MLHTLVIHRVKLVQLKKFAAYKLVKNQMNSNLFYMMLLILLATTLFMLGSVFSSLHSLLFDYQLSIIYIYELVQLVIWMQISSCHFETLLCNVLDF